MSGDILVEIDLAFEDPWAVHGGATPPKSAEDVLLQRFWQTEPAPDPIAEKWEELFGEIPAVLRYLAEHDFPDGELKRVGRRTDQLGVQTETKAVWQLTSEIYLISNGELGVSVRDPLKHLEYEIGQVSKQYIIERYRHRATIRNVHVRFRAMQGNLPEPRSRT